jgi:hypothetical protein
MAGKSIEDILRQQAAQRQAQIQQQQAQERALNEQRERQRQEHLQRMRMYEKLSNFNPSAAAASSAGGRRSNTSISNESILYYNFNEGVFTYFIYNFESEVLTDVKEISLENGPSIYPVTRGGFFIKSLNDTNSNYDLLFISLNGEIIWQDTSSNDSDVDIENFSRYIAAYYLKDGIWKLVVFNKNGEIKSFNFQNPIEGGGYSYDDVWNGGFVVREDISDIQKFYIINFESGTSTQFHEIDTNIDSLNIYLYAFSNKILTIKNGDLFEVFNSNGQKISEFNVLDEFNVVSYSYDDFVFLNDNGSFILVGITEDTRNIIFFSGVSNQFSYERVDTGDYQYYTYDVYGQKDYTSPRDFIAEGSAIFMFYNDIYINGNEGGVILPVWSTDSVLRDFYELSMDKGIVANNDNNPNQHLDDSNIAITRNADYISLLMDDDISTPIQNYSILRFNREGDSNTIISTNIPKNVELEDDDQINGKTILQLRSEIGSLTASAHLDGDWGWNDLSDLDERFFYSFNRANNNDIEIFVIDQEFVMKDIVNDQYWGIKFTEWESGSGGGFAYTRQLITGGTFSGDIISFTHSSWESEPDVIVAGVLEIKRSVDGPIYNSAVEGQSNGENPIGTLWNSEYVHKNFSSYNYKWWATDPEISNPTSSVSFNNLFENFESGSGVEYGEVIDWTSDSGRPSYLPEEDFAWQVECLLKVEVEGNYLFNTRSDDGNQLTISGNIVTEFYGGRGFLSGGETSSNVYLTVGVHSFRYRMQQGSGGSGASVRWKVPGDVNFSTIPSSNLVADEPIYEYDHYIVNTEGQVVDKVTTDEYSNNYERATYILEDEVFGKTWVSNNQNDKQFQLLTEYYTVDESCLNTSEESGLKLNGNFIISDGFKNRIVTDNSIGDEFITPSPGLVINKIGIREIFNNGACVIVSDESNTIFYLYNISGELVGQKSISEPFFKFNTDERGNRFSIRYLIDGIINVVLFNGTTIREFETNLGEINISINDYDWWVD